MLQFKRKLRTILKSIDVSDEATNALVRFVENEDIAPDDLGCMLNRHYLESIMKKGPAVRIERLRDEILDRLRTQPPVFVDRDGVKHKGEFFYWRRYTDATGVLSVLTVGPEQGALDTIVRTDEIVLVVPVVRRFCTE